MHILLIMYIIYLYFSNIYIINIYMYIYIQYLQYLHMFIYFRNIGLCLPNPSSLRNWTMSVNAEPGFQRDVFSALKQFNDEDRDCNLVFDSMAIRKQVMWDKQCQKYIGYCNYGNELHLEGSDTVATQALVIMLVGINGKWK